MNISIYLYISNAQFLKTIVSNLDGSITLIDFYYILHNMNCDWFILSSKLIICIIFINI